MTYWYAQIDPRHLAWTVLNDLIERILIEEAIDAEKDHLPRSFGKDVQNIQKDFFKNTRLFLDKNRDIPLIPLSEQQLYDALRSYALKLIFTRYLQSLGKNPVDWRNERWQKATITYFLFPRKDAPVVPDRQAGWLFHWWFLRRLTVADQQGETGHA